MARNVRIKAEYLRMLAPFISQEETRYYLNGVCIAPHPEVGVLAVATDGHCMGVVHDADGSADGEWICRVPRELLAACTKQDKKISAALEVHFTDEVAYVAHSRADGDFFPSEIGPLHVGAFYAPAIDGKFADWRRVVPKGKLRATPVTFNAKYLNHFARAALVRDRAARMTMFVGGKAGPAAVRFSEVPEFLGIIMPIRGIDISAVPDWLALETTKAKAAE